MKNPTDVELKTIQDEYEAGLVIPTNKPSKNFILAPIGLVGSGKTTILEKIAEKLPMVIIMGDEIRRLLKKAGFSFDGVYEIGYRVSENMVDEGFSIAADSDCVQDFVQDSLKKISKEKNVPIIWIHINTPEEQCLKNIEKRRETIFGAPPEDMIATYHRRKLEHHDKPFSVHFTCTFSGDQENTDKEIDICVADIKKELNKQKNRLENGFSRFLFTLT